LNPVETRLKALMREGLAGNAASYRMLLTELSGLLRAYFLRRLGSDRASDAEDLVQETLMAVHAKRATYDASLPFTPWLHAVARYKLIDHFRHSGRATLVPIETAADVLFSADDGHAAEARLDAGTVLAALPERSRRVVRQVKLEGLSIAEVSAQSGLSPSAVKVIVHRGLKVLALKFGKAPHRDDDA